MSNMKDCRNPLVSVIIPAYNHEAYISIAVETACKQTYSPIEVIVIDDGSTDGTRDVLRGLKEEYDFHYIENENNLGLTKSLNVALKHVQGKYFSILAGDDYWMLDKIATQVLFMEHNSDVAACSGKVSNVDGNGNLYNKKLNQISTETIYHSFTDFIEFDFVFPAMVVMVRKDLITQIGGYDERYIMEDLPLWLKLSSLGWKLAVLPNELGFYRLHGNNMHSNNGPMFENHLRLFGEYSHCPGYRKGIRALYARQIKFGPTLGWRFWVVCIIRGFAFKWSYFKNYGKLIQLKIRPILGK